MGSLAFLQLKVSPPPQSPEPFPSLLLSQRPPHQGTSMVAQLAPWATQPVAPQPTPAPSSSPLLLPRDLSYTGQEAAEPAPPSQRS